MNLVRDLDGIHEQQRAFRDSEHAAVEEATALPVEEARERLAELAAKQQAWLAEQQRMLRDRVRQHAQMERAGQRLTQVERDMARGRGWSM